MTPCARCDHGTCRMGGLDCGPCPTDHACPFYVPVGVREAAWADVRAKAEAIVATGGVELLRDDPDEVEAYVMSGQVAGDFPVTDGGPYDVILSKRSWENQRNVGGWVQGYLCECMWGRYNSGSSHDSQRRWVGRFCSHSMAVVLATGLRARKDFMDDRLDRVGSIGGPMRCAHCGREIPPSRNCLCRECEERATFNHLVSYAFRGDGFGLRWLEANAHDEVVDDIERHATVEDVGGGVLLVSWRGRKALVSERQAD